VSKGKWKDSDHVKQDSSWTTFDEILFLKGLLSRKRGEMVRNYRDHMDRRFDWGEINRVEVDLFLKAEGY
jgi:hypothetical protein